LLGHTKDLEQINYAKREAIVWDEGICVVSFLELVSAPYDVVNVAQADSRHKGVEVLQGQSAFILVCESLVVLDHVSEVVIGVSALLLHQPDWLVKHLDCFHGLATDAQIFGDIFEFEVVQEFRNEFKKILVVLQTCVLDHSHEAEGIAYLTDSLPDGV
jgi:hypothetical protein